MAKVEPLVVCSREEVQLLLDLAREHAEHVKLSYRDRGKSLELSLVADSPELCAFFRYMLGSCRLPSGKSACRSVKNA